MKNALILFFCLLLAIISAHAQNLPQPMEAKSDSPKSVDENPAKANKFNLPPEKLNPMRIPRFEIAPVIDGKIDEALWQQAAAFKDFFQTSPGDNIAPSKPTVAYLGYDAENLYVAFYCWDEPDKIRATVAKRDEVLGEDNVRIWLDTYNDRRRAYVLAFNPLGIQQDGIYTEGQGADFSVDVVMESKGVILADGWSVEAKIPFKSLRYSVGAGKMWGFNVARNIDRFNDEFDSWLPDDRNISGFLIKHGKITGIQDIKVERTLEIVPSITVSQTSRRYATFPFSGGRFVDEGLKQDIGVNFKFNITPNITLDAAYNPDFAEVEADAPVVSANQRFPIFFEEKRPFFLEGTEIFQSPTQVFYSRTIVDPDIAVKLTGKTGKNSFGVLVASDNAPGNFAEDELLSPGQLRRTAEFVEKNATFAVLRLKRDVGRENNIGFYATARLFPEQKNVVAGFDGRYKVDEKTVSSFQILGTHSRRCLLDREFEPDLNPVQAVRNREICQTGIAAQNASPFLRYRTGNGLGYLWNLDHTAKNNGWLIEASGRTRDYRTDAGFNRRTNINRFFAVNRLSTEPKPKAKVIRIDWRQFGEFQYNFDGRSQDANLGTSLNFTLQKNTFARLETGVYYERIFEEEFGLKRTATRGGTFFGDGERSTWQHYMSGNLSSTPSQRIFFSVFLGLITNAYDFDFGGGDRFPRISPAATALGQNAPLDPGTGRQFDLELSATYKPINPLSVEFEYSKSNLRRSDTGKTAFDSNIFTVRSTYQFTRFTFARARWDYDTISSNARGQVLVGYNPNPGTAFYVGYNDNFNYNGFNPYTSDLEPRFERNGRTFFIRASYLFRKSF